MGKHVPRRGSVKDDMMPADLKSVLIRQFNTAWELAQYHLNGLSTEECLWRPAQAGLHVWRESDGNWRADWPEHEGYDLGPASIAWLTWHMGFWWSMVLDHSFGDAVLRPNDVAWPGNAELVQQWIKGMADRWMAKLEQTTPQEMLSHERTRWPFEDRPFADVIAWATVELTKNAAEIGYVRFLYSVRQ